MISAAADPSRHFCWHDDLYSQLVGCIFVVLDEVTNYDQCVVDAAASLLSRLPSSPIEIALDPQVPVSQVLESLSLGYFEADTQNPSLPTQKSWNDLVVASKFSANMVRAALLLIKVQRICRLSANYDAYRCYCRFFGGDRAAQETDR